MDHAARVETFLARDIGYVPVVYRTRARNVDAFSTSRQVADAFCFDILFDFAQNVIELAARNIALHLLIPLVIFPTVQPCRELGAFFKRQVFDGSLNLG
jgi:hypothetical protein